MAGNLIVERTANVAVITINGPKVLNVLNTETLGELRTAFRIRVPRLSRSATVAAGCTTREQSRSSHRSVTDTSS